MMTLQIFHQRHGDPQVAFPFADIEDDRRPLLVGVDNPATDILLDVHEQLADLEKLVPIQKPIIAKHRIDRGLEQRHRDPERPVGSSIHNAVSPGELEARGPCPPLGHSRKDNMFVLPAFYGTHGIVSTVDVLIKGAYQPYGVLEIDNDQQHDYDEHDINFLTAFANVLAEAVATSERASVVQTTIEQMRSLVEDKDHLVERLNELVEGQDRLLDQKRILAEELQHRVRNNLQLVYGMLSRQLQETSDEVGQRGLRAIARRVSTLAQVYDHLLGSEMSRTTDFGGYLKSLCLNLAEIQIVTDGDVTLTCESDAIILDLDMVTALGIVVTELVTNSFDHAFSNGDGAIVVSARREGREATMSILTIGDNGSGFVPQAESKRHGLGLVRRLIEQVRGTISVASDHGTIWTITFSVAAVVESSAEPISV